MSRFSWQTVLLFNGHQPTRKPGNVGKSRGIVKSLLCTWRETGRPAFGLTPGVY